MSSSLATRNSASRVLSKGSKGSSCQAQRTAVVAHASTQPDWRQAAAAVVLSAAMATTAFPQVALAVPQTSACAVKACDGNDYSGKDLRKEFYTKGSLKGANFSNANLMEVSLFGANLEGANLTGANLSFADLGQANLDDANLTNADLTNAIVSRIEFKGTLIEGADFTGAIIRKDINDRMCRIAKGTNPKTGVDTRESLNCP